MSLQEKLQKMKTASAENVSPEIRATMQRAAQRLNDSDILQRAVKVGDRLTDFALTDAGGEEVSLRQLRQQGAVVISLYRGVW